jgi:ribosomal protein S18 acetylase RimI-like enzyme
LLEEQALFLKRQGIDALAGRTGSTPAEVETMITEPLLIKEATTEDVPFLQAMIWEAMLASPIFVAHYGVETLQHLEEEYWSRWQEQPDPAFVAVDARGQKLGAITLKPNGEDEPVQGWRIGIAVEPQARGHRVGQHLLERAIAFAREKGARYVNLFVDPTNRRAIALYHRVGFVEVDERDQLIEMRINLTEHKKEE